MFAGLAIACFALITVNLFTQAMAALEFIREFGAVAIMHGALWQVAELLVWGAMSLASWLAFKVSEHALEERYLTWARRMRQKTAKAKVAKTTDA
ncbi:hypothetical protein [Candidatus Rhodobacter oscarellae]|uniref:hypothetical protein n=1 Tax=Candidatus Rhodobacter oscarellae TaxID=1675527 RepID=UPI00128F2D98|nr:hypothetical protein [Candidatus Rhodobacter lobularis]